jgi:hypothetical protein
VEVIVIRTSLVIQLVTIIPRAKQTAPAIIRPPWAFHQDLTSDLTDGHGHWSADIFHLLQCSATQVARATKTAATPRAIIARQKIATKIMNGAQRGQVIHHQLVAASGPTSFRANRIRNIPTRANGIGLLTFCLQFGRGDSGGRWGLLQGGLLPTTRRLGGTAGSGHEADVVGLLDRNWFLILPIDGVRTGPAGSLGGLGRRRANSDRKAHSLGVGVRQSFEDRGLVGMVEANAHNLVILVSLHLNGVQ